MKQTNDERIEKLIQRANTAIHGQHWEKAQVYALLAIAQALRGKDETQSQGDER